MSHISTAEWTEKSLFECYYRKQCGLSGVERLGNYSVSTHLTELSIYMYYGQVHPINWTLEI